METKFLVLSKLLEQNLNRGLQYQEKRNKAEEDTLKYCKIVSLAIQIDLNRCIDLEKTAKLRELKDKEVKDFARTQARSKSRGTSKNISKTPTEKNLHARKSREKLGNNIIKK